MADVLQISMENIMSHASDQFSRRDFLKTTAVVALAGTAITATPSLAAKLNLANGVAIQGYDPVAYVTQDAAVAGDASITADYQGATYRFVSTENRDAFVGSPERYAPQYGGFCAYAVSQGYTAPIDPQAFSVVDDKLYLNFSKGVRSRWAKDIPGNIKKGDANWPALAAN